MTAVEVAIEGFTKRRILIYFVRQALRAQSTLSVRGSSRRIMCMRFRPANTRVIKRRVDRLVRHLCRPPSNQDEQQNPSRKKVLTRLAILECQFQGQLDRSWTADLIERTEASAANISVGEAGAEHLRTHTEFGI